MYKIYFMEKLVLELPSNFFFSRKFKGIRMNHKECKELKEIERERYFKEIKRENKNIQKNKKGDARESKGKIKMNIAPYLF